MNFIPTTWLWFFAFCFVIGECVDTANDAAKSFDPFISPINGTSTKLLRTRRQNDFATRGRPSAEIMDARRLNIRRRSAVANQRGRNHNGLAPRRPAVANHRGKNHDGVAPRRRLPMKPKSTSLKSRRPKLRGMRVPTRGRSRASILNKTRGAATSTRRRRPSRKRKPAIKPGEASGLYSHDPRYSNVHFIGVGDEFRVFTSDDFQEHVGLVSSKITNILYRMDWYYLDDLFYSVNHLSFYNTFKRYGRPNQLSNINLEVKNLIPKSRVPDTLGRGEPTYVDCRADRFYERLVEDFVKMIGQYVATLTYLRERNLLPRFRDDLATLQSDLTSLLSDHILPLVTEKKPGKAARVRLSNPSDEVHKKLIIYTFIDLVNALLYFQRASASFARKVPDTLNN